MNWVWLKNQILKSPQNFLTLQTIPGIRQDPIFSLETPELLAAPCKWLFSWFSELEGMSKVISASFCRRLPFPGFRVTKQRLRPEPRAR